MPTVGYYLNCKLVSYDPSREDNNRPRLIRVEGSPVRMGSIASQIGSSDAFFLFKLC